MSGGSAGYLRTSAAKNSLPADLISNRCIFIDIRFQHRLRTYVLHPRGALHVGWIVLQIAAENVRAFECFVANAHRLSVEAVDNSRGRVSGIGCYSCGNIGGCDALCLCQKIGQITNAGIDGCQLALRVVDVRGVALLVVEGHL